MFSGRYVFYSAAEARRFPVSLRGGDSRNCAALWRENDANEWFCHERFFRAICFRSSTAFFAGTNQYAAAVCGC